MTFNDTFMLLRNQPSNKSLQKLGDGRTVESPELKRLLGKSPRIMVVKHQQNFLTKQPPVVSCEMIASFRNTN